MIKNDVNPLGLIPTDDLITELADRFDSVIIVAHTYDTKEASRMIWNTKGNKYMLLGLSEYMTTMTRAKAFADMEDME